MTTELLQPLRRMRRSPAAQRGAWLVLGIMVVVALVVGWHRPTAPRRATEIATIEADTKCPSCEDLSVADSTAPTAIAARQAIVHRIDEGETPAQVQAYLVSRYGPGILLRPPTSGATGLVWEIPLAGGVVAIAALGVVFWRRRRVSGVDVAAEDAEIVRRMLTGEPDADHQEDPGPGGGARPDGSPGRGRGGDGAAPALTGHRVPGRDDS